MGYGVHRFTGAIDDNLICGVCGGVLEEAVLTPCGHSFCLQCLQTWLDNPSAGYTCPECRSRVRSGEARPILSIRNLIRGLEVSCEYSSRGCPAVLTLDSMISHMNVCGYVPVSCPGCGETLSRDRLPGHLEQCQAAAAAAAAAAYPDGKDDGGDVHVDKKDSKPGGTCCWYDWPYHDDHTCGDSPSCKHQLADPYVSELSFRVTSLEIRLEKMRAELDIAEAKNKKLERELRRTRQDLEHKRYELLEHQQRSEFDPDYEYGYTPKSIAKLSSLISRHLTRKPSYVDVDTVYTAVKRCYDNYAMPSSPYHGQIAARVTDEVSARATLECARDVHMLLTTAYASNWFSSAQRTNLAYWLKAVCKMQY